MINILTHNHGPGGSQGLLQPAIEVHLPDHPPNTFIVTDKIERSMGLIIHYLLYESPEEFRDIFTTAITTDPDVMVNGVKYPRAEYEHVI